MNQTTNKKPVNHWLFLYILLIGLLSCQQEATVSDMDNESNRIITLAPHLAELVVSAGAINNLIAVVTYSDFPQELSKLPRIGDAFKLDYEAIISLKPDYILTWKGGTPIAVMQKLNELGLTIIETEINTLNDIPKTIAQIAKLTTNKGLAEQNIDYFNKKISSLKSNQPKSQTAFIQNYHKPLYTVSGNHWMSEAVAICGYKNIFNDLNQLSAPVTLESVISKNPDTIINIAEKEDKQWQNWINLSAIKKQQIYTISPDVFSRPSMRLLDGIEKLCRY